MELKTDFDKLKNGSFITLYPNGDNPLHSKPIMATYSDGYFYCKGSNPAEGPDYYLGDVLLYNEGYEDL